MKKWIIRILIIVLLTILTIGGFIIYQGYALYKNALDTISLSDKVSKVQQDSSYIKLENLPIDYKNAVVSVEDHRFYHHGPIDIIAIGRAFVTNIRYGEFLEGGSTITQQVAKNLYFITEDDVISRKIAEIFVAFDLEKEYSKDDILEFYMNTIYFGEGYYGIREASNGYYKKEPKDLNLNEATMLAGVPNAPSVYAPTINPNLAKNRQGKVIRSMVEYGYLSQKDANEIQE